MQRLDIATMMAEAEAMTARGMRLCRCGAEMRLAMRLCGACEAKEGQGAKERAVARAIAETMRSVPTSFAWAHFDAPELEKRVKPAEAIATARDATRALSVVLQGDAGSGKTSLAIAMLRAISERGDRGMFVDARALARARHEQSLGEGEAGLIERAMRARVLVLDEVGAERGIGTAESVVAEVIHERHAWQRQTIYCTPFTGNELADRYGAGIVRRMAQDRVVIKLRGAA